MQYCRKTSGRLHTAAEEKQHSIDKGVATTRTSSHGALEKAAKEGTHYNEQDTLYHNTQSDTSI